MAAGFRLNFNASEGMPLEDKALPTTPSQRSNPTTGGDLHRQAANFRLFHAARDARVVGKVESDHGNLGMYRLRPQQNGFRLLYTLDPPNRIGETDPPVCGVETNVQTKDALSWCLCAYLPGNARQKNDARLWFRHQIECTRSRPY